MKYELRWNDWNVNHIAKHGVTPREAEYIVSHAKPPFPERVGDGRYLVIGQLWNGEFLQVIFIEDKYNPDGFYVIHARPLTDSEKRKYRKRSK